MLPILLDPSPRLLSKYRFLTWLTFVAAVLGSLPLGVGIGLEAGGTTGAAVGALMALSLNGLWLLPTLWLVDRYFASIHYELHEDEMIVRVGIWTHSVKHVPFRTVTNIAVKRDIFDRYLFEIGTLEIQTAGMGAAQSNAEETLAGLVDYEGVYTTVADALRRYRSFPLSPTQADADASLSQPTGQAAEALLQEVRAIRGLLMARAEAATPPPLADASTEHPSP